jgi:hypothetical protein
MGECWAAINPNGDSEAQWSKEGLTSNLRRKAPAHPLRILLDQSSN